MKLVRYRVGSGVGLGAVKGDGIVPLAALGDDYQIQWNTQSP